MSTSGNRMKSNIIDSVFKLDQEFNFKFVFTESTLHSPFTCAEESIHCMRFKVMHAAHLILVVH